MFHRPQVLVRQSWSPPPLSLIEKTVEIRHRNPAIHLLVPSQYAVLSSALISGFSSTAELYKEQYSVTNQS